MPKNLIIDSNGQLFLTTASFFLKYPDVYLTLYLPRMNRLKNPDPNRVTIIEGDILDIEILRAAMQNQDVGFANLAGAIEEQTKTIMKAIQTTGLRRLVFINSLEMMSGERLQGTLDPYRILSL